MPREHALASIALDAAVKVSIDAGNNTASAVLTVAEQFYSFLVGTEVAAPATKVSTPTAEPAPPAAEKVINTKGPTKVVKPAVMKTEPKPEPVKEVAAEEDELEGPSDLDRVKATVKDLLTANLRDQATDLLKKHKAKSSSDLVSLGTEVVNAFIAEAADLMMAA